MTGWLKIHRGEAPLIVTFPHTGTDIPPDVEAGMASPWLARKDADWWIHRLYDFATAMGATTIRTRISRSVIDVNRDPSGVSLYPGQTTTGLCPTESFDGEPIYREGRAPDEAETARRIETFFRPYHAAVEGEIDRLRQRGPLVLYDAHAIRSEIPRLFAGRLPIFNIGSFGGRSCAQALTDAVAARASASPFDHVVNGRFKGGWTTRHHGRPEEGIHAIQMELSMRGYMADPSEPIDASIWPSPYDPERAEPLRAVLKDMLRACLDFAGEQA